ncbi:MAG: hypothetical protein SynsKO_29530 [Synoicihabitans sp.]
MNSNIGFHQVKQMALIALAAGLSNWAHASDAQLWSAVMLKQRLTADWTATWRAEPRFTDNFKDIGTVFLRASVARPLNDWATVSLSYTHLDVRKYDPLIGLGNFREQHWAGAGITGKFDLTPRWTFKSRNTVHLRWIEGRDSPNIRTRHYLEMAWSPENSRRIRGLYTGNEFFNEIAEKATPENRFTPIGARIKVNTHTNWTIFYLIRSTKPRGSWQHAHVFGSYFSFNL